MKFSSQFRIDLQYAPENYLGAYDSKLLEVRKDLSAKKEFYGQITANFTFSIKPKNSPILPILSDLKDKFSKDKYYANFIESVEKIQTHIVKNSKPFFNSNTVHCSPPIIELSFIDKVYVNKNSLEYNAGICYQALELNESKILDFIEEMMLEGYHEKRGKEEPLLFVFPHFCGWAYYGYDNNDTFKFNLEEFIKHRCEQLTK